MGDRKTPFMILYHYNFGYPLLSEKAELFISSRQVTARDEEAEKGIKEWGTITKPQACFQEQCYYHSFGTCARIGIFNKEFQIGFMMQYNPETLPCFTQWKMMGVRDYVMGLEPGNCNPQGRAAMREAGELEFLLPGETREMKVRFDFFDQYELWNAEKRM